MTITKALLDRLARLEARLLPQTQERPELFLIVRARRTEFERKAQAVAEHNARARVEGGWLYKVVEDDDTPDDVRWWPSELGGEVVDEEPEPPPAK
jgi:hypothetical protein